MSEGYQAALDDCRMFGVGVYKVTAAGIEHVPLDVARTLWPGAPAKLDLPSAPLLETDCEGG